MLLKMQIGNVDSGNNCTSQDKDKITSINITDDSFISVNNSKHKIVYRKLTQWCNWGGSIQALWFKIDAMS